ncbi:MAG TPA: SDR family NAD(P)-dependent oxidoreductase [Bdellovibrionota bacterium]|jgi:serine 3-dehydrogenase
MPTSSLKNGTVVITGATSGFGEATARLIAKSWPDAKLWITGRRKERLDSLVKELGSSRVSSFCFDVSDRKAVENFAKSAGQENITVLVNNAGLAAGLDHFQDASVDDWDQMIDTNLKGLLYMTRALLPGMIARKTGHIVNMGSIAGHVTYPKGHVYVATKSAVRALTESLRIDILGSNVRVTSIDPGMAETEFSVVRFHGDQHKADAVYKGMRPLVADDIAEAILWSLDRPPHVNIQEIILMPTDQATPRDVSRK